MTLAQRSAERRSDRCERLSTIDGVVAKRRRIRATTAGLVLSASIGMTACGDSRPGDAAAGIEAIGDAYVAVLLSVVPPTEPVEGEPLPVLYVWEFSDEPMSLDDQVVVIDHFDDTHDVRFVDEFDAAVDPDQPESPPRDDGLLIGLGPITVEPPHEVRVELYQNADTTTAIVITLRTTDGVWTVTDEAPVEPEAFDAVA